MEGLCSAGSQCISSALQAPCISGPGFNAPLPYPDARTRVPLGVPLHRLQGRDSQRGPQLAAGSLPSGGSSKRYAEAPRILCKKGRGAHGSWGTGKLRKFRIFAQHAHHSLLNRGVPNLRGRGHRIQGTNYGACLSVWWACVGLRLRCPHPHCHP